MGVSQRARHHQGLTRGCRPGSTPRRAPWARSSSCALRLSPPVVAPPLVTPVPAAPSRMGGPRVDAAPQRGRSPRGPPSSREAPVAPMSLLRVDENTKRLIQGRLRLRKPGLRFSLGSLSRSPTGNLVSGPTHGAGLGLPSPSPHIASLRRRSGDQKGHSGNTSPGALGTQVPRHSAWGRACESVDAHDWERRKSNNNGRAMCTDLCVLPRPQHTCSEETGTWRGGGGVTGGVFTPHSRRGSAGVCPSCWPLSDVTHEGCFKAPWSSISRRRLTGNGLRMTWHEWSRLLRGE